jgi:hypothetical protein
MVPIIQNQNQQKSKSKSTKIKIWIISHQESQSFTTETVVNISSSSNISNKICRSKIFPIQHSQTLYHHQQQTYSNEKTTVDGGLGYRKKDAVEESWRARERSGCADDRRNHEGEMRNGSFACSVHPF